MNVKTKNIIFYKKYMIFNLGSENTGPGAECSFLHTLDILHRQYKCSIPALAHPIDIGTSACRLLL